MNSDIAFLVAYPCPRCGTSLEAPTDEWQDWKKCPSCGKAGRPPALRRSRAAVEDILYIGAFGASAAPTYPGEIPSPFGRPGPPAFDYTAKARSEAGRRILIGGGFFLATFLALVSVVQKNPGQAGIFGFGAVLLLFLLARSSARG